MLGSSPHPQICDEAVGRVVPAGRLVELCAGADIAQTSAAVAVLVALQRRGAHVAWVAPRGAGLFPPDWERAGLELDALLVVHVPDGDPRAGPRATEMLLRTGVMGAVVLDLSSVASRVERTPRQDASWREASAGSSPGGSGSRGRDARSNVLRGEAWMGRLLGLAREHGTRLVLLSPLGREQSSLGPLVSVRLAMRRACDAEGRPVRDAQGRLALVAEVLKDKSGLVTAALSPARREPPASREAGGGEVLEAESALRSLGEEGLAERGIEERAAEPGEGEAWRWAG